jgi:hypothetical protein
VGVAGKAKIAGKSLSESQMLEEPLIGSEQAAEVQ